MFSPAISHLILDSTTERKDHIHSNIVGYDFTSMLVSLVCSKMWDRLCWKSAQWNFSMYAFPPRLESKRPEMKKRLWERNRFINISLIDISYLHLGEEAMDAWLIFRDGPGKYRPKLFVRPLDVDISLHDTNSCAQDDHEHWKLIRNNPFMAGISDMVSSLFNYPLLKKKQSFFELMDVD